MVREGRVARSWRLTRTAWSLVRGDRAVLALAACATLCGIGGAVLFMWLSRSRSPGESVGGLLIWVAALGYPITFLSTFFNVAIAAAANAALEGQRLTFVQAIGCAGRRLDQVALWALVVSGIGLVVREVGSRLPGGGRLATGLLGAAWTLVSFLAIPVLAVEGCGGLRCIRRSSELLRRRWGETVGGNVAITAWAGVIMLPAVFLLAAGFALVDHAHRGTGVWFVVVGLGVTFVISGASGAVRQVFAAAVYRYAVAGTAPAPFSEDDLSRPFVGRGLATGRPSVRNAPFANGSPTRRSRILAGIGVPALAFGAFLWLGLSLYHRSPGRYHADARHGVRLIAELALGGVGVALCVVAAVASAVYAARGGRRARQVIVWAIVAAVVVGIGWGAAVG